MEKTVAFYHDVIQYLQDNYLNLGFIILFTLLGFFIANFIKSRIKKRASRKSVTPVTSTFISQIVGFGIKTAVVLISLYLLGLNSFTNKILAGAGLLTFVIGFALKDIGENFLAGIILAFKSPFKLDDIIEVEGIVGFVKDINIRETQIKTPDGKDVFLPNSIILKNAMYNYTIDGYLRYDFELGIAYEDKPMEAVQLILKTVNSIEGVLKDDRKPVVFINELAVSTINIKVLFWLDTFRTTRKSAHSTIRSQVINEVTQALIAGGFSLPASIVELKNYGASVPLHVGLEKKV
jgi:small-conductance mechanosensitive channel